MTNNIEPKPVEEFLPGRFWLDGFYIGGGFAFILGFIIGILVRGW